MIRISSTELIDAIFEECNVSIADRIPLMKILEEANGGPIQKKDQDQETEELLKRVNVKSVKKLEELIRIKGNCDQLEDGIREIKNLQCRKRFDEAILYFRRLEEMLQKFN